jgi:uncharacterized membrane protein YcaP (DUF421 family)
MDAVVRAAVIYAVVWTIFRLTGRRTFAEMTSFDFILLLIVSESVQQGLLDDDFSLTNAALVVLTLVGIDLTLSIIKQYSKVADRLIDSLPIILLADGKPLHDRMQAERVDEHDLLEAAREHHGLERLDQVKFAVLERNGHISIVPCSTGAE